MKTIIGTTKCWVCKSELPLPKIPEGCRKSCVDDLLPHDVIAGSNPPEKAWLCPHHLIVWHDRQRKACLK